MEKQRNMLMYAGKEAGYSVAQLFISGTMIQLFLAHKGASSAQIGAFSSVLQVVSTAITLLLSDLADRHAEIHRLSTRLFYLQAGLYLLYLPLALVGGIGSQVLFYCVLLLSVLQTVLVASKGILEYKLLYEIAPVEESGRIMSFSGIGIGVLGIAAGQLFAALIDRDPSDRTYFVCMVVCAVLLFLSAVCCGKLRTVGMVFRPSASKKSHLSEIRTVLCSPDFIHFLVPNALRGVTHGVFLSITLIALASGLSAADTAKLAVMSSVGHITGSGLYFLMAKSRSAAFIGMVGAILVCPCVLMTFGGSSWFLWIYLISYIGKVILDYAIVVLVMQIIDPAVAGVYNAWRNALLFAVSSATVLVVGLVVDWIHPLWILVPCALSYLISMIWYAVSFRKRQQQPARQNK